MPATRVRQSSAAVIGRVRQNDSDVAGFRLDFAAASCRPSAPDYFRASPVEPWPRLAARARNLSIGLGVGQAKAALGRATANLLTKAAESDASLITLRRPESERYLGLVTTSERPGRTIDANASAKRRAETEPTMGTSFNQPSARIYQFPRGGRAALGGRSYSEAQPTIDQNTPRVNEAMCSGSWYHEEAIREDNPTFKPSWDH